MRKIRMAIVGPADSVSLIQNVVNDYNDQIDPLPIVYHDASEVPQIMSDSKYAADVWVFSGKVPYTYAINRGDSPSRLFYIPHTGSSLHRVFNQMLHNENRIVASISFDTFSQKEIEETFSDLGIPTPAVFVNDYLGIVSAAEMTRYHYRLWREGKTQAAVTCFLSTYLELRNLNVPAYRIWPTRDSIRTTIAIATQKFEALLAIGRQIAIQHIKMDEYEELARQATSSYAIERTELKLQELLLNYTETVKGSLVSHGKGHYTIYSTRGLIEEVTKGFTEIPVQREINLHLSLHVSGGIGFGQTALAADENANTALSIAKQHGKGTWMAVFADRTVIGPLNSGTLLEYSLRDSDERSREIAQLLNISGTTANRLLAFFKELCNEPVTAETLASYLSITPRSARRLLSALVQNQIAYIAGEETAGKGRPGKLYQLLPQQKFL